MPKGLFAGVPAYVKPARGLGDFSSVRSLDTAVRRDINRLTGKVAGGSFAAANTTRFGVFGMIATAQFFSILKQVIQLQTVEAQGTLNIGTVMDYADDYEHGGITGAARPFFLTAIKQTPFRASKSNIIKYPTSLRSGLYEGQKFHDDFAGFFRGDSINRIGRRTLGREISGFWGSLRLGASEGAPNILEGYAKRIIVQARKNVKIMGQDTGTMRASLTHGFGSKEMSDNSRERALKHINRGGHQLKRLGSVTRGVVPIGSGNINVGVQA